MLRGARPPGPGWRSDIGVFPLGVTVVSFPIRLKAGRLAADVLRMTSREGAGPSWLPLTAVPTSDSPAEGGPSTAELTPAPTASLPSPEVTLPVDLPMLLRDLEDAYIRAALARTQSNKKEAAKLLGMGRTTLVEKLRRRNLAASRSS